MAKYNIQEGITLSYSVIIIFVVVIILLMLFIIIILPFSCFGRQMDSQNNNTILIDLYTPENKTLGEYECRQPKCNWQPSLVL